MNHSSVARKLVEAKDAELARLRAENERLRKKSKAWRNRLASELSQQGDDGYEMRRARAEARVNEFEDAIDAAMGSDKPKMDRASQNPGGCECLECGVIFIGGPEHDRCGICAAMGGEGEG